jgi:hypothetical protein
LEFIWIFSDRNHLKINISHNSESKSDQINSIKSCSSRSFQQQHQRCTFQFLRNSQLPFNIISSEEIIQYSRNFCTTSPKHHETKTDAPLLLESFPTTPRRWSEASWFGGSHWYKQTNNLPS